MSPIHFYPAREPGDPAPSRRPSAGPWRSHDVTDEQDPDCGSWVVDVPDDDGEITVTRLYFGDMETNTGRDIANADLVAAAPELLAALLALRGADTPIDRRVARTMADEAIAKARTEGR